MRVDGDAHPHRQRIGQQRLEPADGHPRDGGAAGTPNGGEQQTLGQESLRQLEPPRPQRRLQHVLLVLREGPREQQIATLKMQISRTNDTPPASNIK